METKVNFRITKQGEIIAIFTKRQRNGKFLAYSLYDNMHFDADSAFIRECKPAKKIYSSELLAYLKNRGYKNIKILLRMNF